MADLKTIIGESGVPDETKAQAWEYFHDAGDKEAFKAMFDSLDIPDATKAQLWNLKYGASNATPETVPSTSSTSPLVRFGSSFLDRLLPVEAIKGAAENPLGALKMASSYAGPVGGYRLVRDLVGGEIEGRKKEFQAAADSNSPLASRLAHGLAGVLPLAKPAVEAGEQIGQGDVAGGLGTVAGEATGLAGPVILGKAGRGIKRMLSVSPSKQAVLEAAKKLGIRIPLDQQVESQLLEGVRKQAEASILGGAAARNTRVTNAERIGTNLQGVTAPLESVAMAPPGEVGQRAVEAAKTGSKLFHKEGSRLYQEIEGKVNIGPVLSALESVPRGLSPELDAVREYAVAFERAGVPVELPFEQAQALKSYLAKKGNPINILMKTSGEAKAGNAASILTEQMKASLGEEGAAQLDKANRFYKEGAGVFGRGTGKKLASLGEQPQGAVNVFKPQNTVAIGKAKEAISGYAGRLGTAAEATEGQQAWDSLRAQFVKSKILGNPEGLLKVKPEEMPAISKNIEKFGFAPIEELMGDEKGQRVLRHLKAFGQMINAIKAPPQGLGYQLRRILTGMVGVGSAGTTEVLQYAIVKGLYSPRTASLLIAGARRLPKDGGKLLALGVRMGLLSPSPTSPDREDRERAMAMIQRFGGVEQALAVVDRADIPLWDKDHLKKALKEAGGQ